MTETRGIFEPFDREACDNCGLCLRRCPVMELSPQGARREISRLRHGGASLFAMSRCRMCFACNLICPQQANPAQLILDRFYTYYRIHGVPAWASYFQPHAHLNFRSYVARRLPQDEKYVLAAWEVHTPREEFVFPGCNLCVAPYLTQTKLLENLHICGGLDLCCGEPYYRTGQFDRLAETARRLNHFVRAMRARRMMILCPGGFAMFKHVLPQYGFDAPVEVTSYLTWLLDRHERGDLPLEHSVDMTVTVQDSCYGALSGAEFYGIPRRLLEAAGARVREMPYNRESARCTGFAGGIPAKSGRHPADMFAAEAQTLASAALTGADAIVTYCAGDLLSISTARALFPTTRRVYHLLEILSMAAGEIIPHRNASRGRLLLQGILKHQFPRLISSRRYRSIPLRENRES